MCFSASASFIAGASLSAIGVAALKSTKTKRERPLAMIPFLFGIQPLAEGVIWLTFSRDAPLLKEMMTYVQIRTDEKLMIARSVIRVVGLGSMKET